MHSGWLEFRGKYDIVSMQQDFSKGGIPDCRAGGFLQAAGYFYK